MELLNEAQRIYNENFKAETCFERAIFFSWGCTIGDCSFCYMSTQPKDKPPKETKRSFESILAECIIAKKLDWDIGFITGGIGVLSTSELLFLLKAINKITRDKVWLSVGPLNKKQLEIFQPFIKGVVGSTETINPVLHKKICPSKPLKSYEKMFEEARKMNIKNAMTFIVGMGETKDDFQLLKDFIKKYNISKIHVYGLIPQKGTVFENSPIPTKEDQAWWISQLRINFPKLDIQCGIWEDRIERIHYLLHAGANTISKFKAIKLFGSPVAREIEEQAKLAGRRFKGTLTKLPDFDWNKEIDKLALNTELKERVKQKLDVYIGSMLRSHMHLLTIKS